MWAIASDYHPLSAVTAAAERAHEAGTPVNPAGKAAGTIRDAAFRLHTPCAPSAVFCLLLSALPGQLFTWALARAEGLDPDRPANLTKITMAP